MLSIEIEPLPREEGSWVTMLGICQQIPPSSRVRVSLLLAPRRIFFFFPLRNFDRQSCFAIFCED